MLNLYPLFFEKDITISFKDSEIAIYFFGTMID